ncbi:hypothetical protein QE364_003918 [Nocardioides zeae]|uniref:Uncharacterized protein n=1 Tax=Nocardioides zeae TaxID=1457234 RepID=A0ACC6INF8_9ACTN|nr:hypothetical protein [Nocardioides zeae]MDR6212187.1 hypothetical protein [Nocardioides zeae]
MTRPDWWTWLAAVEEAVPNEGVYATALVWGRSCWNWRQGEWADLSRAQPLREHELGKKHPAGGVVDRTVRRRLKTLVDAGLLERIRGHSRWSPDTYAPTLPNTGQEGPELEAVNTGQVSPEFDVNTGRQGPEFDVNTGQPTPQHRTAEVAPPFPTEVPETSPARTHAHTREGRSKPGGITPAGEETMHWLLRRMDHKHGDGTSSRLAEGWRDKATVRLSQLRAAGWPEQDLVNRLMLRDWSTADSIGRVLMSRLDNVAAEPVPTTAAERARERSTQQRARAAATCAHGTPGGPQACPLCRHGAPEDDDQGDSGPLSREEALARARSAMQSR